MSTEATGVSTQRTYPPVVTMFEQYGAGAAEIGHKIAEALGIPFHAQAFSSEELEAGPDDALQQNATLATVFTAMGGAYGGFEGRDVVTTQQQKYELIMNNNRQVQDWAGEGGVIIGRNGAVILAKRPNTVHVLLTGELQDRIKRASIDDRIPADRARRREELESRVRVDMSKVLYGWDPSAPDRYDLVFNTSRITVDAVVAAVVGAIRNAAK